MATKHHNLSQLDAPLPSAAAVLSADACALSSWAVALSAPLQAVIVNAIVPARAAAIHLLFCMIRSPLSHINFLPSFRRTGPPGTQI